MIADYHNLIFMNTQHIYDDHHNPYGALFLICIYRFTYKNAEYHNTTITNIQHTHDAHHNLYYSVLYLLLYIDSPNAISSLSLFHICFNLEDNFLWLS